MNCRERVIKSVHFNYPDRIPVLLYNRDFEDSDMLVLEIVNQFGNQNAPVSEWGFRWEKLDRTMGQPKSPVIQNWQDDKDKLIKPNADAPDRFLDAEAMMKKYPDKYYLASLGLSGFAVMTCIRGFNHAMMDFYLDDENESSHIAWLADQVFDFEYNLIPHIKAHGFHGIGFFDDWGTQQGLIIDPKLWRSFFKPRYQKQFARAHEFGLDVYFHCCGQISAIIPDLVEIGVDMLNISQPNVFDIEDLGRRFSGKVCFVCPVSYQTTGLQGSRNDIFREAERLVRNLGQTQGGFIGYVEDYPSIGMSEDNYHSCVDAFMTAHAMKEGRSHG